MNILVINSGSSTLKYQLIDVKNENVLAKGVCERVGLDNSFIKYSINGEKADIFKVDMPDHMVAISKAIEILTDDNNGVISGMSSIDAIGHRVVHGGERFHDSVVINDDVRQAINDCIELAPLHNPPNIAGIDACRKLLPDIPMVAVFDTAFHQTIPEYAYLYAIPYKIYEKYGIRKYGFHGTSHKYVSQRASALLGKPCEELNLVSCHLGNGASVCAIKNGKSVDTSMGFTPLAGLAMGTRSGTIDPAVISFLMKKEKMSIGDINDYLNRKSGILGVSGISSDFRDIQDAAMKGNKRAKLAIDIFCYRVRKYIAEYGAGVLNGLDAVIFTGGIGENNSFVREKITEELDFLGIKINYEKNKKRGMEMDISKDDARVRTLVIPTNEELEIARETMRLVK